MSELDNKMRQSVEAWLPEEQSLCAAEVASLLQAAGADPAGLGRRAEALAARSATLAGCVDFQAMFAAYRTGQLAPERVLLLDDHIHACVACRKALHAGAAPEAAAPTRAAAGEFSAPARAQRFPAWAYGAVAAGVVALALVWAARVGMLPGQSPDIATVVQASGGLYAVQSGQVHAVNAGFTIDPGEHMRTGPRLGNQIQLSDGSRIELGRRAEFTLTRGWGGTTFHLLNGQVIVQAARQGWARHLVVATDDSQASVKGTVFSVDHGLMGSRIAVVEGVVGLDITRNGASRSEQLQAGQEVTTNSRLAVVPIADAIDWSQNAQEYLALLAAVHSVEQQLQQIPSPPARYSSVLVQDVPATTAVYVAVPNLGDTLSQANQIIQNGVSQSPELSQWWNQAGKSGSTRGQDIGNLLSRVQQISSFLGSEVVVAVTGGSTHSAVVLAEVTKPGLAAYLEQQTALPAVTIVNNPASLGSTSSHTPLVWIGNNRLVASINPAMLQATVALVQSPNGGTFTQTPLYQQIAPIYQQGASWLLTADLNQLHPANVQGQVNTTGASSSRPQYVVAESRPANGGDATTLAVTFSGPRQGLAGIVGAPGPMGSLQFISPSAGLVVSLLTETPASVVQLLMGQHKSASPSAAQQAMQTDAKNLAAELGGEFTVAQDGPVLPKPTWKAIIEVNDSVGMQQAVAQFIADGNSVHQNEQMNLAQQTENGQTFYTLTNSAHAADTVSYTYAGSYLVAGSSLAAVQSALGTYTSGDALPNASAFQNELPDNGHTNFSAILYHNLGPQLAAVTSALSSGTASLGELQPLAGALLKDPKPGLVYAYGKPQQIELASTSGLLGMSWPDVMGWLLHQEKPATQH